MRLILLKFKMAGEKYLLDEVSGIRSEVGWQVQFPLNENMVVEKCCSQKLVEALLFTTVCFQSIFLGKIIFMLLILNQGMC